MKQIINLFIIISVVFATYSCEKQDLTHPEAKIVIDKTLLNVNESFKINFVGKAEQVVIYTGDDLHNYDSIKVSHTGLVVNKNLFTYAYSRPGTYKLVCVASNYDDMAVTILRDTVSHIITVVDNKTDLLSLSCPNIRYDEVFAVRTGNNWLMRLPQKIKYGTSANITINNARLRLRFGVESDSTKVYVGGDLHTTTTNYNLSQNQNIKVVAHSGAEEEYTLYPIQYPEFGTFSIAGVSGAIVRNEYDYSILEVQLSIEASVDLSRVIPQFTLANGTNIVAAKVFLGGVEQTSGVNEVNFNEDVEYVISTSVQDISEMTVETKVRIVIIRV